MSVIRNAGDPVVAGYWGDMDATIDWCENNYVHTQYIAEFWYVIGATVSLVICTV